tara:strand:- start:51 stop:521 length:471 start_codon:yes stop_codon:yes gene_type:complete
MSADPRDPQGPVSYRPANGLGHMPAYMVAAHPYITGSGPTGLASFDAGSETANTTGEHTISFPYVTRKITVINDGDGAIRVHFRSKVASGIGNVIAGKHFVTLDGDEESMTFNIKCKEIYISNVSDTATAGYVVYAELTTIPTASMYTLTGSGITA